MGEILWMILPENSKTSLFVWAFLPLCMWRQLYNWAVVIYRALFGCNQASHLLRGMAMTHGKSCRVENGNRRLAALISQANSTVHLHHTPRFSALAIFHHRHPLRWTTSGPRSM